MSGSTALLLGALLQAGAAAPILVSHGQKGTQAAYGLQQTEIAPTIIARRGLRQDSQLN